MDRNSPIRVLHVLTAMNRAGVETMLMNLYRKIDKNKIQFDFAVTVHENCDYNNEIISLGGKIIKYPKYIVTNHFSYKKWWNDFFNFHHEYKIVHGHIGSTASIYLKIAKKYGIYTIAHSHSAGSGFGIHSILYRAYSFSTRYIADYFIGCSKEALIARYGKKVAYDKSISTVLPNSIDVAKYAFSEDIRREVCDEFKINKENLVIGTVGRQTASKNPMFILKILYDLNKIMDNYIFLWIGVGDMKWEIEKRIREYKLEKKVMLLGVRDDVPRIIQALNLLILPSKYEGLPVIGVEAQAAGLPLLCSDKVSQEVKISECVSFLPINNTEPWIEGILKEKNFRRIKEAPNDVIKAGYDIEKTSLWLTDFYLKHWKF